MPTKRTRKGRNGQLGGAMYLSQQFHAKEGDCLLAGPGKGCACGLRDYEGNERKDLIAEILSRMEGCNDAN